MRRRLSAAGLLAALVVAGSATADPPSGAQPQKNAEPLNDADLVRELTDNTLTGFNGSLWFSEYHAPDGRVLGHNAGVPNQDSCWKVRGNAVCYYYPRDRQDADKGTAEFCWHFIRAGPDGYRVTAVGQDRGGVARLEPGNARGYTQNGRAWPCEDRISRRERRPPAPQSLAARETGGAKGPLSAAPSP